MKTAYLWSVISNRNSGSEQVRHGGHIVHEAVVLPFAIHSGDAVNERVADVV